MMLDSMNGHGLSSELSLCDSAAKCTTRSLAATRRSTRSASAIEPSTKVISSSTGASEARLPAYVRASMTVISQSGRVSRTRSTKLDPMKPAAPVTRTFMVGLLMWCVGEGARGPRRAGRVVRGRSPRGRS